MPTSVSAHNITGVLEGRGMTDVQTQKQTNKTCKLSMTDTCMKTIWINLGKCESVWKSRTEKEKKRLDSNEQMSLSLSESLKLDNI